MKELLLLRHAKSSWDEPGLEDSERPLAKRGRRAAPVMAQAIAARGWLPDAALVSPARRTRQTWKIVAKGLGEAAPEAEFVETLYMGSAEQLLAALHRAPAGASRVVLVGHNPGLEDLAGALAGPASDEAALSRMKAKFPTAALARFTLQGEWAALAFGAAALTHFLRPKDLG